jgi:GNAT superfamily N-acetyltransferase
MLVRIVDATSTRELRRSVLRPNLEAGAPLPGDDLPGAVHFGAVDDDGTVACTCFLYRDPCPWRPDEPARHLRQMATLPDRRGQGLGAAVIAAAVQYASEAGARILWCNARASAAGFYARLGFVAHGDVFTDERHSIPHFRMARELSATPTSSVVDVQAG